MQAQRNSAYPEIKAQLATTDRETAEAWAELEARSSLVVSASFHAAKVLAEGDSWFDYPRKDVVDCLDDKGYRIHSVATGGHLIEDIAHVQLAKLVREIRKRQPRFLLLSGGGNDIAGDELAMLVNHRESRLARAGERLRGAVVRYLFDSVFKDAYQRILETCSDAANDVGLERFDIIGHGYANPFADGRPAYWIFGPWLRPALERRGYTEESERNALMAELLDEMNTMQSSLAAEYANYHYIDLRPDLTTRSDWANELHPTQKKFVLLAHRFHEVMQALIS